MNRGYGNRSKKYYNNNHSRKKSNGHNVNNMNNELNEKLKSYIMKNDLRGIIEYAEKIGKQIQAETNQVRRIYSPVVKIQNQLHRSDNSWKRDLSMLKPRVIYAATREKKLQCLKEPILKFIEFIEKEGEEDKRKQAAKNFCQFMEAIVAYHKQEKSQNSNTKQGGKHEKNKNAV